jgi:hypothetical protein
LKPAPRSPSTQMPAKPIPSETIKNMQRKRPQVTNREPSPPNLHPSFPSPFPLSPLRFPLSLFRWSLLPPLCPALTVQRRVRQGDTVYVAQTSCRTASLKAPTFAQEPQGAEGAEGAEGGGGAEGV